MIPIVHHFINVRLIFNTTAILIYNPKKKKGEKCLIIRFCFVDNNVRMRLGVRDNGADGDAVHSVWLKINY